MEHCRKVKGEQVIILQMDQQIKTKNISDIPRQLFCCQINLSEIQIHFLQGQTHCFDDQDKFQPVKDIDNEFTEYQTLRKKLQSIGISPVRLHAFTKNSKSNFSEALKVQVDYLNNSESHSFICKIIFACLFSTYPVMNKYVEVGYVLRDASPIIGQRK